MNSQTITSSSFTTCKIIPLLNLKTPHITFCFKNTTEKKPFLFIYPNQIIEFFISLFQILIFKRFITNIDIAISIIPDILYYFNLVIKKQLDICDDGTHKVYIKLMKP